MQSQAIADWRTNLLRKIGGDDLARRLGNHAVAADAKPQRRDAAAAKVRAR